MIRMFRKKKFEAVVEDEEEKKQKIVKEEEEKQRIVFPYTGGDYIYDEKRDPDPELTKLKWKYYRELEESDGFYVGSYPNHSNFPFFVVPFYNPPERLLPRSLLDHMLSLSQLAIAFYNIKEDTCYGNVQVLRTTTDPLDGVYNITFKASLPSGNALTFQTRISLSLPRPCRKVVIQFLRFEGQRSPLLLSGGFDLRGKNTRQLYTDSRYKLAHYLSQFALQDYDTRVKDGDDRVRPVYDIRTLNVVEPIKPAEECPYPNLKPVFKGSTLKPVKGGTTYHTTFEASLYRTPQNVDTFETLISMPPLFPTTPIKIAFLLGTNTK